MTPETKFKRKVKAWLDLEKIYHFPYPGSLFGKSGIPDTIMCVNGIMIAVEFKTPSGVVSELQKEQIRRINTEGGIAVVLYPEGFDTFKRLIKEVRGYCTYHTPVLKGLRNALFSISCDTLMN